MSDETSCRTSSPTILSGSRYKSIHIHLRDKQFPKKLQPEIVVRFSKEGRGVFDNQTLSCDLLRPPKKPSIQEKKYRQLRDIICSQPCHIPPLQPHSPILQKLSITSSRKTLHSPAGLPGPTPAFL
ncbi:hypothetical protein PGTUg99_010943 [Puccinia graminis f. sp. tritici]|uniref:Uncharacterized protein n=1 Tax=Puccinia graminis f. sp. tritici TaxID=56615 RepID=A0A5B0Q1K9_PUCGR|nr:hypothetical protein PGTUg99_010943 [Puccinia graminis f. sp. tritici]